MKNKLLIVFYLLAILFFAVSFVRFLEWMNATPHYFFNADAYYYSLFFRDVFVDHYPVDGWALATAPCFVPELLVVFLLSLISNEIWALYLWPAAFVLMWCMIGSLVVNRILKVSLKFAFPVLLVVGSMFLILAPNPNDQILVWLFSFVHPHGSVILALAGLYFYFQNDQTRSLSSQVGLTLICVLGIVSDKLFVPLFIGPMLVLLVRKLFFSGESRGRYVGLIFNMIFFSYLASRVLEMLRGLKMFYFASVNLKLKHLSFNYLEWLVELWDGLIKGMSASHLLVLSLSAGLSLIYLLANRRGLGRANAKIDLKNNMIEFIIFMWVATALVVFSSGIVGKHVYKDPVQLRYLSGVSTLHFLFLGMLALQQFSQSRFWQSAGASIFVLAIGFYLGTMFVTRDLASFKMTIYQDPLAACLDKNKDQYDLKEGLSDYWNAKPVTLFSKTGIRVNQLTHSLDIYHWVNNLWWYYGKEQKPDYNFIISDRLDQSAIAKFFGAPIDEFDCEQSRILVYAKKNQRMADFLNRPNFLLINDLNGNN